MCMSERGLNSFRFDHIRLIRSSFIQEVIRVLYFST